MKSVISKPTSAVFGVLLVCAASYAQSGSDLRSKYGPPAEAYEVRPNVLMTVVFAADGQACEMVIEARHTSKAGVNGNYLIPQAIADEVLNEVAPMKQRGKGGRAITFSGGCSSVTSYEYENVSFFRSEQCLQGGGKAVLAITIKWKHRQCPKGIAAALAQNLSVTTKRHTHITNTQKLPLEFFCDFSWPDRVISRSSLMKLSIGHPASFE